MERLSRQAQKEKTRAGLTAAAEKLFAHHGFAQTTTADVAEALRVSHGTVFVHFPTREDLILAVIDRFGERLSAELGRRLAEDLPLKKLLQAHLLVLAEFEDFYMRLISESPSLPAQVRSLLYAMNASISYRFYRVSKPLMKAGELKAMEQALFFNTWLSLVHFHLMNRDLFSEKRPVLKAIGENLIKHFMLLMKP